eukprot:CAMPEP_0194774348 /NCGR_PEP_ID=MMETSP0323_2-20130528/57371_1 /TAXON_ID=2866 ORGANISM="Crypthecodinium cohnii, Strain Seligo" /NCGR_SAMPLE_ID=MMETSP0323_2 /ASSEMBLY_ACC=CAM_ASM_000346 /LENGTH=121 /DNA_ID=CAMNT_0039709843 /DNA_START=52 /DNA_END=414 /DNA_ORIENTATION=-
MASQLAIFLAVFANKSLMTVMVPLLHGRKTRNFQSSNTTTTMMATLLAIATSSSKNPYHEDAAGGRRRLKMKSEQEKRQWKEGETKRSGRRKRSTVTLKKLAPDGTKACIRWFGVGLQASK